MSARRRVVAIAVFGAFYWPVALAVTGLGFIEPVEQPLLQLVLVLGFATAFFMLVAALIWLLGVRD